MYKRILLTSAVILTTFVSGAASVSAAQVTPEQPTVSQSIENEQIGQLGVWTLGSKDEPTTYTKGTQVIYNGGIFRTLQTHANEGDIDWNPEKAEALFIRIGDAPTVSVDGKKVILTVPENVFGSENRFKVYHNGEYIFEVDRQIGYYSVRRDFEGYRTFTRTINGLEIGDEITVLTAEGRAGWSMSYNRDIFQSVIAK